MSTKISSLSSGGIPEAPIDGFTYGRKNATWVSFSGVSGVNGGAFITDIIPTSTGNVGTKVYDSDGIVLQSCVSDTQLVTVSTLGITGNTHYKPIMSLRWGTHSQVVTLTAQADKPLFIGSTAINLAGETNLSIEHEDGAITSCTIALDSPPVISSANFTGGYPGTQTELKLADTFSLNIVSDIPIIAVQLDDYGAYSAQSFSVVSGTNHTVIGVIANRGTTVQSLGAKVRVQKSTGSWSTYYLTEDDGSVDGTNLVKLNNLYPTVSTGTKTYPASQGALKDSETATIVNTVTNYDTVLYDSPNGDLTITNATTVETPKTVTRLSGNYNISTNNFRITATRTANNAISTTQTVIYIAHVACTLTVTEPASRLRSGGNDSTSAQNHVITITANQNLYSAPTLVAGAEGVFQGAGFAGSGTTWTRSLQVTDTMVKQVCSWGSISGTNLAGIQTVVITGDSTYTIGGFVSRTITLPAYTNTIVFNTEVIDYAKLTFTWSVKALPNKRVVGTSTVPDANSWSIDALSINPTTAIILDTAATNSSSVPTTVIIEELV